MSVYKKLQKVRVEMAKTKITKSGFNSFSKYNYFELDDFLPSAQLLMETEGLCSLFQMGKEIAELVIINSDDKDDFISFEIPVKEAHIKGAQDVQNLGGTITYLRIYLWINALELTEKDAVDSLKQDLNDKKKLEKLSPEELKAHEEKLKKQHEEAEKKKTDKALNDFLNHSKVKLGKYKEEMIKAKPELLKLDVVSDKTRRNPIIQEWMHDECLKKNLSPEDVSAIDVAKDDFSLMLSAFKKYVGAK